MVANTDLIESSKKMDAKAKRKLRQTILEKLFHEHKSEEDEEESGEHKCSKKKKVKVNKKSDDRVEKINENTSKENETIQCKQKKVNERNAKESHLF